MTWIHVWWLPPSSSVSRRAGARPPLATLISPHRASARRRRPPPRGEPRLRAAVALDGRIVAGRAALEHGEPGRRGAERPGHADEVARSGAVAADELALALRPAHHGHRDRQRRPAGEVAAGDRGGTDARERLRPAVQG